MSRNYATCASAHEALWRGHSYSLGSFAEIGALKPRPTIAPSFTTTAPTGTSPCPASSAASRRASRIIETSISAGAVILSPRTREPSRRASSRSLRKRVCAGLAHRDVHRWREDDARQIGRTRGYRKPARPIVAVGYCSALPYGDEPGAEYDAAQILRERRRGDQVPDGAVRARHDCARVAHDDVN